MTVNVLQLQEVGDFEALNCLPAQNLIRSTKLHLTTEPPFCQTVLAVRCSCHSQDSQFTNFGLLNTCCYSIAQL